MSKKNRFKNHRAAHIPRIEKAEHAQKNTPAAAIGDYNMMSDFIWLFVIIFFYTGVVVALYYYDSQTHALSSMTEKILSII